MKNLRILTIILISLTQCIFAATERVLQQSFEEAASDNWAYTPYPDTYTGSNPNWSFWTRDDDTVDGMDPLPDASGSYVWTMENTNFTNTDVHTLTFDTVDLSSYSGSLSLHFSYYTLDYNNQDDGSWSGESDEIGYAVAFDNGSSWDNYTELSHGTNEWIQINVTIPDTASYVRLRIFCKNDAWNEIGALDYIYLLQDDQPLPITLSAFSADAEKDQITLNWTTDSETENAEFIIYRDGMILDKLAGAGTTSEKNTYSYVDYDIIPGNTYTYSLADRSLGNVITEYKEQAITVKAESGSSLLADSYSINSAYPNPFNPSTMINYTLSSAQNVNFAIFNVNGEFVQELVAGHMDAGAHSLTWNASQTPAGVYILRSNVAGSVSSQKLLLLK